MFALFVFRVSGLPYAIGQNKFGLESQAEGNGKRKKEKGRRMNEKKNMATTIFVRFIHTVNSVQRNRLKIE